MIELGNKCTFFDLRRKPCNSAIFTVLQERKKFRFLWTGKTKITLFIFNRWKREIALRRYGCVCLFPSIYLTVWWRACVSCVVSGRCFEKIRKGAKCVLFRVVSVCMFPLPLSSYMTCYAFVRFCVVGRYTGQKASGFCVNCAASFCTLSLMPFYHSTVFLSSFCFPLLCNNRAILSKVADLLAFLI